MPVSCIHNIFHEPQLRGILFITRGNKWEKKRIMYAGLGTCGVLLAQRLISWFVYMQDLGCLLKAPESNHLIFLSPNFPIEKGKNKNEKWHLID